MLGVDGIEVGVKVLLMGVDVVIAFGVGVNSLAVFKAGEGADGSGVDVWVGVLDGVTERGVGEVTELRRMS